MAAYQYIYVMKGLGKTYPGGREVLNHAICGFRILQHRASDGGIEVAIHYHG